MQLHRDSSLIRDAGAELAVIGNGAPTFIQGFREQTGWTGALYTDPSLATFEAARLKRSAASTFDPRGVWKGIRAFADGHRQGRTQGDAWQQGGVLVVATDGQVKWHHASDRPGDNATGRDILAALR